MNPEAPSDNTVILVAPDPTAWDTLRVCAETLDRFGVKWRRESAEATGDGAVAVVVASCDGMLPARWSARTRLPTLRVPVAGGGRDRLALLQTGGTGSLPAGSAVGMFATMAIGAPGAKNAALFLVAALATTDPALRLKLGEFRREQTDTVLAGPPLALPD